MWIPYLTLISAFVYVILGHILAPQNEFASPKLSRRVKIDNPQALSCSRNERRIIVGTLREATTWASLGNDTAWDVTENRPSNEQYQNWRGERRSIFERFFETTSLRTRREIGQIFNSLLWELERSPGGARQNDDEGGNVQIYCDKYGIVCRGPEMYTMTNTDISEIMICPRFFRSIDIPLPGGSQSRIPGLPAEPTQMFGSRTGANADKSRPGHLIITLLETKAVGRRRLRGGSHPAGIVNFRVTLECLKFEAFVTDLWLASRDYLPAARAESV